MAAKDWRMLEMCENCPFRTDDKAIELRPGRLDEIKRIAPRYRVVEPQDFYCHKTAHGDEEYDDDGEAIYVPEGGEKLCAGAIDYQDSKHVCTQYRQIAERLDYFAEQRVKA